MSSDLGFPINPSAAGTAVQFASDTEVGTGRRVPHNAVAHYNFVESTGNSSTANIAGNGNFPGAIESTSRYQATQIAVFCDKAYKVEVIQYSDAGGTRETARNVFTRQANQGFCEAVNLNDWFFRVKVTNLDAGATSIFSCQTSQGPIQAGPKAVGPNGGMPVEIVGYGDPVSYFASLVLAPTIVTTGANLLALRNPSTNKILNVLKLELLAMFTGTAAASRSAYAIRRAIGCTALSANTAVVPEKSDSTSAASVAQLGFNQAASITLTGATLPATNQNLVVVGHPNQLTANVIYDRDMSDGPIVLRPNEVMYVATEGAIVAGSALFVGLRWTEE